MTTDMSWLAEAGLDPSLADLDGSSVVDGPAANATSGDPSRCGALAKTTGRPCQRPKVTGFPNCPDHITDGQRARFEATQAERDERAERYRQRHQAWREEAHADPGGYPIIVAGDPLAPAVECAGCDHGWRSQVVDLGHGYWLANAHAEDPAHGWWHQRRQEAHREAWRRRQHEAGPGEPLNAYTFPLVIAYHDGDLMPVVLCPACGWIGEAKSLKQAYWRACKHLEAKHGGRP